MLWTDGPFVAKSDLLAVDPEVVDVAALSAEPVDGSPNSIIQMAISECGIQLMVQMQRFGGFYTSGQVSTNHMQAVLNGTGGSAINRSRTPLGQIVVDDIRVPALKTWVVYNALQFAFRAASSRTAKDRYKDKVTQYRKDIDQKHWPRLQSIGLPCVSNPLPCPGATLERSGTWGVPDVSTVSAPGATGGTFFITITYVDQTRWLGTRYGVGAQAANNAESFWAVPVSVTTTANQAVSVSISHLIPPTGIMDPAQMAQTYTTPGSATGWLIYAGASVTGPFYLQTPTPVPIATLSRALTTDPILSGAIPNPQYAESYFAMPDIFQRG